MKIPLLFTVGCVALFLDSAQARPNVLLILTDDQDVDTVGCYGGSVQTPHIDSLAADGIRFSNANVVHSICSPSRYAILTGRYYDNSLDEEFLRLFPRGTASCVNNDLTIEDDGMNLPAVLKANGYVTGYIGKYHLTNHELLHNNKNWEEAGLQTYPMDADPRTDAAVDQKMKANQQWWQRRMKEIGYDVVDAFYPANLREMFNEVANVHNVEWTTDAANRFLTSRVGKDEPFFLCVATTYNHGPLPHWNKNGRYLYSLDADVQMTGEGVVTNRDLSSVLAGQTRASCRKMIGQTGLSEAAPFAAWWDAAVGSVLNTLKETGADENTLVIYLSDHGLKNSGKSTLYEAGTHVPFLMRWPQAIRGGRVYDHVVGSIDLAPTVMEACGISLPTGYPMDGVSLMPALRGSDEPVREALFMEMGYAHGVKTDHWKYIAVRYPEQMERKIQQGELFQDNLPQPYLVQHLGLARKAAKGNPHYFARNQLFNLEVDPDEENNVFLKMPEKGAQMKQLLQKSIKTHLPHRPYGEFNPAGSAEVFQPVANAVWMPARD